MQLSLQGVREFAIHCAVSKPLSMLQIGLESMWQFRSQLVQKY